MNYNLHPYLEVINVGQGDCMILRPRAHCALAGKTYIVDTGDGTVDFTKTLGEDEKITLILTHSHRDHIGGLFHLMPKVNQIQKIILPFYQDEITIIAKAISNLIGFQTIPNDSWPIISINDYNLAATTLYKLSKMSYPAPKILLGYEDLSLCDHFTFLNPPIVLPEDGSSYQERISTVCALFTEPFASKFQYWLSARLETGSLSDSPILDQNTFPFESKLSSDDLKAKGFFVLSFFENNYQNLTSFTQKPSILKLSTIVKSINITANQASLVFRFVTENTYPESFLFTGDVDVSVFDRLIDKGIDIRANILKVPHHGSKTGLNDSILKKISPVYAIISHDNRKFGRSPDPHPNTEIIELLKKNTISVYVTNDVIKNGSVLLKKQICYRTDLFQI